MKIELKHLTTNKRLSQETTAFAADVWVDGKKAGHARNDGGGGSTLVHLDPSVRDRVEAHGRRLVPAEYEGLAGGVEWIVDQLVEAELQQRSDRAFARRVDRADAQERAEGARLGLRVARFRHDDTWRWFRFKGDADPGRAADALAAKNKVVVEEIVVLS